MAQPRQYQIDRLRESINRAFANSENILEENKRSEELEFLRTKRDEIAERMGAEALKKKLRDLAEYHKKVQTEIRDFMYRYAGKYKLQDDVKYIFGDRSETLNESHIDAQVDQFARKHAERYMNKSKAMKQLEALKQVRLKCVDIAYYSNDIEKAQAEIIEVMAKKVPFVLEKYSPALKLLEAPQPQAEKEEV